MDSQKSAAFVAVLSNCESGSTEYTIPGMCRTNFFFFFQFSELNSLLNVTQYPRTVLH